MEISFPPEKRIRVIVNTDAKNEADDQFAIVHAILTPAFELHGIIPAHFGTEKSDTSMEDSYEETMLLLRLMEMEGQVRVEKGATAEIPDATTPMPSPGAELIIDEAMKDDPRPLHIAFYGPITDMASALLMEPRIEEKNIRVIWIGGRQWPEGGTEYNLSNDIEAANVVFRSKLEVWQIPRPVYRRMPVSYAELLERVYPHGEIGKYLVEQTVEHNEARVEYAMELRSLGDSPCVGVMMHPDCGDWDMRPAPEFNDEMFYVHTLRNRPIRVYRNIDNRFILEDLFAKLARFARNGKPL
ncbi:MAG: nucleoside hydrolase [Sphaerobacteraceae bacterium]|nr:MAG: nucleoside hydrolase [Sphaerobacteraceae bacterium]